MRRVVLGSALLAAMPALAFGQFVEALAELPVHSLPAPLTVPAPAAESVAAPLRIASGIPLALDESDGRWDFPEAGIARWRLRLSSAGARHLSTRLSALQLPEDASLWLQSSDGRDLQGPFDGSRPLPLLLPLVRGSEAVLAARMPLAAQPRFRITVNEVFHGERDLTGPPAKGGLGDSAGSCHIDVACADGNNWRDDIRAAVVYTRLDQGVLGAGVMYLCSGLTVNNARQDSRALVLTANHCGVSASQRMSDVQVYFNVQKSRCNGTDDGPINQVLPGGSFLDSDAASDFSLFELASRPPASYNVYYAGWDVRTTANPSSGVGIHHPGGDDKKISTYLQAPSRVNSVPITGGLFATAVDAWQVHWSPGRGVTEQGSSGSGLWNQDRRVIGVLSGGSSSCSQPTEPDLYGRLDRAWPAGLKSQLDPDNSGVLVLNGRNAGASGSAGSGSSGSDGGGGGGALDALGLILLTLAGLRAARRRRTGTPRASRPALS